MHPEVLTARSRSLLPGLAKVASQYNFYLAGGTVLALQYGHRRSVDFDFFSRSRFDVQKVKKSCAGLGTFTVTGEEEGTLHGTLDGVRLTFLHYPYKLLYPLVILAMIGLADPRDISCMKLQAVAGRGSKKDFFDLYELLQRYSLAEILSWFESKYGKRAYNRLHLLKSLIYFNDAETEPEPRLIKAISWGVVKKFMRQQIKDYI